MSTAAVSRLRDLPPVFSLTVLAARLGGSKEKAAIYAKRWKEAGLVAPAGPRLGIYFNLVVNPQAATDMALQALQIGFPEAVICGESVLHDAGWTTQIPWMTQVIVSDRRSLPEFYGFELHKRPMSWFVEFADQIQRESFPRLTPAGALADLWKNNGRNGVRLWLPDIDDLEEDEIDWTEVRRLFDEKRISWPENYPAASLPAVRPRNR